MKRCSRCCLDKNFSCFGVDNSRKDGLNHICKVCKKEKDKNYRDKNKNKISVKRKESYNNGNKDKILKRQAKYRANNPKIVKKCQKRWRSNNKSVINAHNSKRRAKKLNATLEGYNKQINSIYANCPEGHHVDHIIPLTHPEVCGLHVPWNLQYLTAEENLRKSNKLIY